jgi:hypothetical protein
MDGRRVDGTKVRLPGADHVGPGTEYEGGWRGYCAGSRDEAYEELERIERLRADKAKRQAH